MTEILPEGEPLDLEQEVTKGNPALRIFGWTVLVSALSTFALGTLAGMFDGRPVGEFLFSLLFFAMLGVPVACAIAALVFLLKGRREHALGFFLAALATPLIGFGACFAAVMLSFG